MSYGELKRKHPKLLNRAFGEGVDFAMSTVASQPEAYTYRETEGGWARVRMDCVRQAQPA